MGLIKDLGSISIILVMLFVYGMFTAPEETNNMLKGIQKAINDFKKWVNRI